MIVLHKGSLPVIEHECKRCHTLFRFDCNDLEADDTGMNFVVRCPLCKIRREITSIEDKFLHMEAME